MSRDSGHIDKVIVSTFRNDFAILQAPGHYIHGPKTTIHVLQKLDKERINAIFVKEFNKTLIDDMTDSNDVGILYTVSDKDTNNLFKPIMDDILISKKVTPKRVMVTCSNEWPAVILLQPLVDHIDKPMMKGRSKKVSFDPERLYMAMSRARVKCTVIMFPEKGAKLKNYHSMCTLLDKLKGSVEVIYD